MKKTVTSEVTCCDVCEEHALESDACLRCGKVLCWEHQKTLAREYSHGVHFHGSGDGVYCNECDVILGEAGTDELHKAYRAIANLRDEATAWSTDFRARTVDAERHLQQLLIEKANS